jgi:hypothetical protein
VKSASVQTTGLSFWILMPGSISHARLSVPRGVRYLLVFLVSFAGCSGSTETPNHELVPARLAALGREIPIQIEAREHPVQVLPTGGFGDCVTEEELLMALSASLPLWEPPSVPTLIHELKLWSADAVFPALLPEGKVRSGQFIVATLLSDSLCKRNTVQLSFCCG